MHIALPTAAESPSAALGQVPIAAWVALLVALVLAGRALQLWLATRGAAGQPDTAPLLLELHRLLRDHAAAHHGRLPSALDELARPELTRFAYRPIVHDRVDEKVLIAHDAEPTRLLIEFPSARPARHVLFWSGRVRLVTQSAFEKLIEADDLFRARIGLDAV